MNKVRVLFVLLLVALSIGAPQGSDPSEPLAQSPAPEPFVRVCGKCHDGARIIEGRRFRAQWEETLDKMVSKGAQGSDEDFDAILTYLVSAYGRVNVNTAAADEITTVLHLEASQAVAIVRFREEHGKFADFDALVKVPGADVEALRKARDAIAF